LARDEEHQAAEARVWAARFIRAVGSRVHAEVIFNDEWGRILWGRNVSRCRTGSIGLLLFRGRARAKEWSGGGGSFWKDLEVLSPLKLVGLKSC
jgi:hypothetical protein